MESEFKDHEEYLKEIEKYREDYLDSIFDKYTNNSSPDFLIDMKTLKVISYKGTEPTIPSYGTLTSYYCEPAQRLLGKLNYLQKGHLECEEKSTVELSTDTCGTAESSQESFSEPSSDEGFDSLLIENNSKVLEKDRDISRKKLKFDSSLIENNSKVLEEDRDISRKKLKFGKPNYITDKINPAFKEDTFFLHNIPLDDLCFSNTFSESSNSINCSSKSSSNISSSTLCNQVVHYVKNEQTVQEQKSKKRQLED